MSSDDQTWSSDGVSLTLASWWTSRKRLFLASWVAMVLVLVVSVVPLSMVLAGDLSACASGPSLFTHEWSDQCMALEPSFAVTEDHRAWQRNRVCALGSGAPADILIKPRDVFFDELLAASTPCEGGWPLVQTEVLPLNNRELVEVVQTYQEHGCTGPCLVHASSLAAREWDRIYVMQYERLQATVGAWEAKPYLLRDGGLALALVSVTWFVLTLLWGLVWLRVRRPIRLHFGPHRIALDGKTILLESLREARLEGTRVVFVVDDGEVRSRALASEVIVDLDSLLVQVRRQDGREDPASIAAVQALLGSSTRA
jgi:hypothetical protein